MAKNVVYFNASKQIETITIHYNDKLDGAFVSEVATNIKDIAKKMGRKVDLKNPREYYTIQVFVYPSKSLFNQIFGGEIEKRFYSRKRSLEDMYVVKDSDGNIHIVSPRGMGKDKTDAMKKILVMKVLGEYMDEKEKINANKLLKAAMKPKEEKEKDEEKEEEKIESEDSQEIEEVEEEQLEEEIDDEELEEIIETEEAIEEIDDVTNTEEVKEPQEDTATNEQPKEENAEETKKKVKEPEERKWLNYGWLAYVRGKLKKDKDIIAFAKHVSKNGVQKLKNLSNSKLFEEYNYSVEYACATVDYIITTYGMKKFVEYYENPKDLEKIFGTTKYRFNADLKAYIYSKYNLKEMKMEIDQKNLNEITEIHFAKSGGADITEINEISKNEPVKEISEE